MTFQLISLTKQIAVVTSIFLLMSPINLEAQNGEITGFNGWSVVIDPGHSQTENMGIFGYSEAEKVLEISLHLRELLEHKTDISEVYLTRDNHFDEVSLPQRTDFANDVAADFFHSVHSDAGPPNVNSTLLLWGGWVDSNTNQIVEKNPNGGMLLGDIMDVDLTHAMRIGNRGSIADRAFFQQNMQNQWPYLHVNRETNMASVLSEGGFHTNPEQNQLNMNIDYLRIEAQSHLWSYMEYLDIDRVETGILSGVISDMETSKPINGAVITVNGETYTTDTYESLFNQYSNDPDQLSNGFYYFDGLAPGSTLTVSVEAEDYYSDEFKVTINPLDFTFGDLQLLSSAPPIVDILHYDDDEGIMPGQNLRVEFNRDMDRTSVVEALEITPEVEYTTSWQNDLVLQISTQHFDYNSEYMIRIKDSAKDIFDHQLDGNLDGNEGGDYFVTIRTSPEDTDPPVVVSTYPLSANTNFFPDDVVQFRFDEVLNEESLNGLNFQLSSSSGNDPDFTVRYTEKDGEGILQFIPLSPLVAAQSYTAVVPQGIEDEFGNATDEESSLSFITSDESSTDHRYIDSFNDGINNWWEPQQSGSTNGIDTEKTSRPHETSIRIDDKGSSGAMRINYGWDEASGGPYLIRIYRGGGLRFTAEDQMHAYVFGDGSDTPIRFVVRDGNNELEASDWVTIDWIGWRLVRWEMTDETSNAWVNGNGQLNGELYIDSIQLSYSPGESAIEGSIILDELLVVRTGLVTSTEEIADQLPQEIQLDQNYPNPFNPTTIINYRLPQSASVELNVYNLTGQLVATVDEGTRNAGSHAVNFDAGHLSSGVYIYRLMAGNEVLTKKMTLIK